MPDDKEKTTATETPASPPKEELLDSSDASSTANPETQPTDSNAASQTAATGPAEEKQSPFKKVTGSKNFYLVLFILLILAAAGIVFAAFTWGNRQAKQQSASPQDLTDEQLEELARNATIVGDPSQTLAIQGNTVFEGQVLARSDVSIAGALKVGGTISIPSIDAGGGSFDQLQVDNNLSIGGDLAVQGQISIQGGLVVNGETSFTNLSVGELAVTSLRLSGDLTISRHLVASGGIPGKTNGSALGGGGSSSVNGSDTAGTVSINTGSSPPAGCFITVNFANSFNGTPAVVVSPTNSNAGSLQYYTNRTSTGFSVCTANAPQASKNYTFDYIVIN